VDSVQWIPTGADHAGAHATNTSKISILDGGTDGTGTAVVASYSFTATVASETSKSIPTTGSATLGVGDFVNLAYTTVATASSTGSMAAGELFFTVEYV
jgi:hypothetical protein